nr:MAG: E2 protein [Neophocaena asiaeorientalis asiaeorientalis papillomavirus 4]
MMQSCQGTMETLCQRLDALQEAQMDLLEQDTGNIQDICKYLSLLRKEAILICAANKKGLKKLGLTVVPPQRVCEANAKDAIHLHLMVCSLQSTQYGEETWLFSDLTHGMLSTKPKDTFKKGGQRVTVYFDGDESNCMEYVLWSKLYLPLEDGGWTTATSGVDTYGIYMITGEGKEYYTSFSDEAHKYGSNGKWKVLFKGKEITDCTIVSSTTCGLGNERGSNTSISACAGGSEDAPDRALPVDRGLKRPVPLPQPIPEKPLCTTTPPPSPETGQQQDTGTRVPLTGNSCGQQYWELGGGRPSDSDSDCGPCKRPRTEPDIPSLLITGGPNQLKCLRFRLKKQHRKSYYRCSTTWCWVSEDGLTRVGNHRIFVSFTSEEQCKLFEDTIPLPKGVCSMRVFLPC